jgi:hypothetical protein
MITTPTVFVLGAGASSDYDFPVGWGLLRAVVDDFGNELQNRKTLKEHFVFSDIQIDAFRTALDHSGENSVDAFLENRREFMELGKLMMAIVLIGLEKTHKLFEGTANENWMRYLLRRMRAPSFEEFYKNQVAFITFNYDRSLEHFLCTTLASAYGKTEAEAGEVVKKIPIIHLHGQLGYLPWQQHADSRSYDTEINKDILGMCIRQIKVVHEGVEDRKDQFNEAKRLLHISDRAYFMGVGFNNVNLERLEVLKLADNKAWSTEIGLTDLEFGEATRKYTSKLTLRRHYNCKGLMSNFVNWT